MERVEFEEKEDEKEKECGVEIVDGPTNLSELISNQFPDGLIVNFEEEEDIEISVLFPLNLSVDKIRGNVDALERDGLTNIVVLRSGEQRSLVLFNLTGDERQMVDAGIVLKTRKKC